MKISHSWLSEYLPEAKSPEELDQILTDTGLEVEGFEAVEMVKGGLTGVIVAEITSCEKHPNADRLNVTLVNTGKETLQVVCGAPNVAVGQKVLLATVGTTLYPTPNEPLKMKVSKIRDVESHGMLCAEDELGLGKGHEGILVLDSNAQVGTSAAEYLELENDTCLEIGLTPNRADAMGHIGVARDVIAYLNCKNNTHIKLKLKEVSEHLVTEKVKIEVKIQDQERCQRYMAVSISGITVKPSPAWLQNKLRAVGISPINNIVDVTNYVMRDLATPLHAFDANFVNGNVIVRTAHEKEKITTLDGLERELSSEDLVIANLNGPMCIAGVFGGKNSGVNENTKEIFLEAAYFQPVSIRKTAKRLGLSTDASFRFERGVDVDLLPYSISRAVDLIIQIAGGEVSSKTQDFYFKIIEKRKVEFRFERCNTIIGSVIPKETIKNILTSLDFVIVSELANSLQLLVPNYRIDVDREIDVIEEILRIYGFNKVALPEKLNTSLVISAKLDIERLGVNISEVLAGMGLNEILNNSLTSPVYVEKLAGENLKSEFNVVMLNPLSQDLAVMRQSMVFQALENISHNQNRQNSDVKLFEFGKIYQKIDGQYKENKRLLIAISGRKEEESWNSTNEKVSFYTLKGIVSSVLERLGLSSLVQENANFSYEIFSDGLTLNILKNTIGEIGWVTPAIRKHFGVKSDVYIADLDWDALIDSLKFAKTQYKELPKFFEVRRDFSLLLNRNVKFDSVQQLSQKIDKKILKRIGLFDVYEGKNLPEGKKSYAVSFIFQDPEQTLKDTQVDGIMEKIKTQLKSELGAELRS